MMSTLFHVIFNLFIFSATQTANSPSLAAPKIPTGTPTRDPPTPRNDRNERGDVCKNSKENAHEIIYTNKCK